MGSHHVPISLRAHNPAVVAAFLDAGIDIRMRLSGFSMKPLVGPGSVLRFSSKVEPRVGDIVLLSFDNGPDAKLVAHRVLRMDRDRVWTKGDSSSTMDPPVVRARVLGSATALEWTRWVSISIPLANPAVRALGRLASHGYPRLARWYRLAFPRKDAWSCAG